jgi:hypothetical protein
MSKERVIERIAQIKAEKVGQTGKRVLLVEGTDDVDAYSIFLTKRFPQWEQFWAVAHMGNKRQLLEGVALERNWLGLVDKDEWSDEVQAQYKADNPNLLVLPRFCLESYLVSPAELWQAFPPKQQAKVEGGEAVFRAAMVANLREWIRHAALWHSVRPLWQQLRNAGLPDEVSRKPPVPTDPELSAFFQTWSGLLGDADALLSRVHELEARFQAIEVEDFCLRWLHAKDFYSEVVHRVLDQLLGQKTAKERRSAIFRTRQVPADLDVVWQAMGLNP